LRIAVDVCVALLTELELWRAGYRVPVRAANSEPDERWLERAVHASCDLVITKDKGAARAATRLGMFSMLIPFDLPANAMTTAIMDGMEAIEEKRATRRGAAAILAPLAAIAVALAACAPPPRPAEPPRAPVPWCFAAVARFNGADQAAVGCFASSPLCENAQRRAVRWGGVAGIKEVGACRRR
jgi:hypothetical protein